MYNVVHCDWRRGGPVAGIMLAKAMLWMTSLVAHVTRQTRVVRHAMPVKPLPVPDDRLRHVTPPSVVATIVPKPPTARPFLLVGQAMP